MIQAVVHSEERGQMGMHYTSVVNIMKVIEPLFLNELKEELDAAGTSKKKLDALLKRLYNLRIFDPACGSGNFLIIAYKELCRLEIEIFDRLGRSGKAVQMDLFRSNLQLTQFYGIELDDFAHETAKLSLWLAEHQMNLEFKKVFGATRPTLPLQDGGNIVCGNATREDWEDVCPKEEGNQVFILGNPPYLGARNQSKEQKADMAKVFEDHKDYKDSDYVCCWYLKGVEYIEATNARFAFVSTNSICQGEQVSYLWPRILSKAEIGFAHRSFKWTNHARGNAGVSCVILGLRNPSDSPKAIYFDGQRVDAANICPYLIDYKNLIIYPQKDPSDFLPRVVMGNMPRDGGHLILSEQEHGHVQEQLPPSSNIVRRYFGVNELLKGKRRWCIWIEDDDLEVANSVPEISTRIKEVKNFRVNSKAKTTNQYAAIPHKFAQRSFIAGQKIILPSVSSERREYVPFGFLDSDAIISNLAYVIYGADPYLFALISSALHMTWVRAIAGRLETRIRYTASLCYNPFPFPPLNGTQQTELEEHVFNVLDQREAFPERTLADLYDPDKMPDSLREAHHQMDLAVERCYRKKPFLNDEERLEYLFKLYETMIEEEKKAQ